MSAADLADMYVHTCAVEMFLGTAGSGEDTFAVPVTLAGFLDDTRHLVRDKDGEQVVSESSFFTYPVNGPVFAPNSRVTINGHTSRVIRLNTNTSGALDLPDHIAVALT